MPDNTVYCLWNTSQPKAEPVTVTQCDGYVVVSLWRSEKGVEDYEYERAKTLNDAYDLHAEYERGEWARVSAVGIFPVKGGLPFGPPLPLSQISAATQEARQDRRDDGEHARLFNNGGL